MGADGLGLIDKKPDALYCNLKTTELTLIRVLLLFFSGYSRLNSIAGGFCIRIIADYSHNILIIFSVCIHRGMFSRFISQFSTNLSIYFGCSFSEYIFHKFCNLFYFLHLSFLPLFNNIFVYLSFEIFLRLELVKYTKKKLFHKIRTVVCDFTTHARNEITNKMCLFFFCF